jgi:DNA modification methylase
MKNKLYYGDNLDVLRKYIKDESVDLCYIDPPFNSKRNYNQIYNNVGKEDKAQVQAFVDTWTWDDEANQGLREIQSNFNGMFTSQSIDLIDGLTKVLKKGSLLAYLVSMTLRIAEIHRVLKSTGSFYLHCDPTASHYLKLILDALFCPRGGEFRNEIVWCYATPSGAKNKFPSKHDVIFFYTKSQQYIFHSQHIPHKSGLHNTGQAWQKTDGDNAHVRNLEKLGKKVEDWWIDIYPVDRLRREISGYPTQKPEALLERIIKASSDENAVILDAYCGCGTTIAVAEKLKRNWIGIDITYQSISLILKRLAEQTPGALDTLEINGVPKDFESAVALANKQDDRTRKEFEKWMVLTYSRNQAVIHEKKGSDAGIDGIAYLPDRNNKGELENRKVLFSVKSSAKLSPAVIRELNGTIERENAVCGILLTLHPMPNLVKESKQYGSYYNKLVARDYPKIQVVSVEAMLNGELLELPNVLKVLKDAEQHSEQMGLLQRNEK